MEKTEFIGFRLTKAQAERVAELAQVLGKKNGAVLRDLIDNATIIRPILTTNLEGVQRERTSNYS